VLDLAASGPRVWAATAAGLARIDAFEIRRAPSPGVARLLAPAPQGRVYALYSTGILRVGDEVEERIDLPVDPARAQADAMGSLADGTIVLGISGEGYVRPPGGPWRREGAGPLPKEAVRHHGETWVPTRGRGILRRRDELCFRAVPLGKSQRVHALAMGVDGSVWCGTSEGLAVVGKDGRVEELTEILGRALGTVTACAVDAEGRVWVGSGSSFTGVFRRERDGWHHLAEIDGYVHRITVDPSGALWFAVLNDEGGSPETGRGAWCFTDGQFRPAPMNVDLPSARVYDVVARDRSGTLWFATLKGLAAFEAPGRLVPYTAATKGLLGEKVWCLCAAQDGALWIGYQQAPGVSRLARGTIEHFDVDFGLCDGEVWSVVEGRRGVFWFATGAGLSRYDGLRWSCFRNEEGLGEEALWPLLPAADGSLWIGTLGAGLVHMEQRDHAPPRTRFKRGSYEGAPVEVSWTGADAWYDTTAPDLRYRTRTDGGRWSALFAATSATLSLPPGEHSFEVQAIDRFGNAEDPPARVKIVVAEPSRFPYPLAAAVAAALLALGFLVGRRRSPGPPPISG
jgi:streptogramin lyase